jgi:beta-N-acetylhexosaminidase
MKKVTYLLKQKHTSGIRSFVGQLLILGFDGTEMNAGLRALLNRIQPAGVILFRRNIQSPTQTWTLLRECQKLVSTPLFRCVDLEGGTVDRFREVLGPSPAAAQVFATGDRRLYRQHGRMIGQACRALGFNVDFAPALDLAFETSRSVMGSRLVSEDPKQVVKYAREFLAGLKSAGVLGSGKHFPGLGEAALDTHKELPAVAKKWKDLWREDLVPYRLMRRELPMVMVSHAAFPAMDNSRTPATLSKRWITGVLREKIGYRGLVVTDDMEMGALMAVAPIGTATVETVRAGADLCLICHREESITRGYEALIREAERDPAFAARVQEAAARVLALKKKKPGLRRFAPPPTAAGVERLTRQLWELGERVRLESIERATSTA